MKIAFDIDDTLWKCTIQYDRRLGRAIGKQVPDYDLIQVLRWFYTNGDTVIVWSAGGVDYAQTIVSNLGLQDMVTVMEKGSIKPDIAFDDMETELGTVDIKVHRKPLDIVTNLG